MRLNTSVRFFAGAAQNPDLHDLTDSFRNRSNAEFLAEVARRLNAWKAPKGAGAPRISSDGVACIGLIGCYGLLGYQLRRAQDVIRVDRQPSHWSHAFLLRSPLSTEARTNRSRQSSAWIWESSLEPPQEYRVIADRIGVTPRRIADYASQRFRTFAPHTVPNMAILAFAMTDEERHAILARAAAPDADPLHYDLRELLAAWFAYAIGAGASENPLATGLAHPGAAYVQFCYDGAGIALAPGAPQRTFTPEHFWQTARHLYNLVERIDEESGEVVKRAVIGWYCVRDRAALAVPPGDDVPIGMDEVNRILGDDGWS